MATLHLPYGKEKLEITVPDSRLAGVLTSKAHEYAADRPQEDIVREALQNPVGTAPLRELVRGKNNVVMIASDHTRPVPSKVMAPAIIDEIKAGNPDAQLTILIATGFHRETTREELIYKFGQDIVDRDDITFVVHKSHEDADMVHLGTLPSGGSLLVNRIAVEADLLIAEGFIEPHFFAGFSGGRKSVLPGVASAATVMANHCSEFIASPYARTGVLDGNPIHTDMIFAAEQAKLAFIVNVVLDGEKNVIRAWAGHFNEAHRAGCVFVDEMCGVDAAAADIVITTNGGYPLDQNIYQAVKGMTAAEATCKPNGVIIAVASCDDGHGGQSFYDTFANDRPVQDIMDEFMATPSDKTIPDQWEAQILARILLGFHVIMVTNAPEQMVRDMRMVYAASVDEAIAKADAYLGRDDAPITVIPDGVGVIVRQ